MRISREELLINNGEFGNTKEYAGICDAIRSAIRQIVWPPGSEQFSIYPVKHANGVVPIKETFVNVLTAQGWISQQPFSARAQTRNRPGEFDVAIATTSGRYFAVEWETGNISSSHRSVNRMLLGMKSGQLIGGALILPNRYLYNYLTDRIGNFEELEPYFDLWRDIRYSPALLLIIAIEQDSDDISVPPIRKGTDGRALG